VDLKEIVEVKLEGPEKHIKAEDADYYAKSVIITTGAEARRLPAEGEREFRAEVSTTVPPAMVHCIRMQMYWLWEEGIPQ
jgi:thioredoxin reductase